MAKINAPGEAPSADRVEKVARSSLGLEDDLDEVSAYLGKEGRDFLGGDWHCRGARKLAEVDEGRSSGKSG